MMTEFAPDNLSWRIEQGDCLTVLPALDADSVDCVITSPPYWGLRDYGDGTAVVWGGEPDCEHEWGEELSAAGSRSNDEKPGAKQTKGATTDRDNRPNSQFCRDCGAWYGQLGLEPHPSLYLEHLWQIFDECRRVLKPTGTVWVVLGDSYGGSWGNYMPSASGEGGQRPKGTERWERKAYADTTFRPPTAAAKYDQWLKPKNLLMIPERFAIGMSERGWWLRNDIAWTKPNAMPSSVRDRFSNCWEHVFFFTKSKRYWFDLDAVRETAITGNGVGMGLFAGKRMGGLAQATIPVSGFGERECFNNPLGKNPRDCWSIPTQPFPEAHFATFPEALVRRPLLAGCPPKICGHCGKPWVREVERVPARSKECPKTQAAHEARGGTGKPVGTLGKSGSGRIDGYSKTLGWGSTCKCSGATEAGLCLDPFAGSGTVGVVCIQEDRRFLGIELSEPYCEMARKRIAEAQRQHQARLEM